MSRRANKPMVRVVCDEPGAHHERRGRTVLGTYIYEHGDHADEAFRHEPYWFERPSQSRRVAREDERQRNAAFERGESSWPLRDSAEGTGGAGTRRPTVTHLRGDVVNEALTGAHLVSPLGPGWSERQHLEWKCRCGLARRARAEDVWPIFDKLREAGVRQVRLRDMIRLTGRV